MFQFEPFNYLKKLSNFLKRFFIIENNIIEQTALRADENYVKYLKRIETNLKKTDPSVNTKTPKLSIVVLIQVIVIVARVVEN